jgi:hypothetical protein
LTYALTNAELTAGSARAEENRAVARADGFGYWCMSAFSRRER